MARINIDNIENVEGKYHLMFHEGREMVNHAKAEIRTAWFSLLFFVALLLIFVIFSGINIFYLGFLGVFLVVFLAAYIYLILQKKKGKKQCVFAVQNSNSSEITNKQVDIRKANKVLAKSVAKPVDKYAKKEYFKTKQQKRDGKKKQKQLTSKISEFGFEEKK